MSAGHQKIMVILDNRDRVRVSASLTRFIERKCSEVSIPSYYDKLYRGVRLQGADTRQLRFLADALGQLRLSSSTKLAILRQIVAGKTAIQQVIAVAEAYSENKDVFDIPKVLGLPVSFFLRPNDHHFVINPEGYLFGCCSFEGTYLIHEYTRTDFLRRIGVKVPFCHSQVSQLVNGGKLQLDQF